MRHTAVTRTAVGLGTALLVSALAFAWLVRDDEGPTPAGNATSAGAEAFRRRCASCHTSSELGGAMRISGEARLAMDAFLRDHASISEQEAGQILDYFAAAGSANGT